MPSAIALCAATALQRILAALEAGRGVVIGTRKEEGTTILVCPAEAGVSGLTCGLC